MELLQALVFLTVVVTPGLSDYICNNYCDGSDASLARNPRSPVNLTFTGGILRLQISDEDNMAYATLASSAGDAVFLERSFDGTVTWESLLGYTTLTLNFPEETSTPTFNVDGLYSNQQIGALRACFKLKNGESGCTSWARSTVHAGNRAEAAANSLMQFYNYEGLWPSKSFWWNTQFCFFAILDYMKLTGDLTYMYVIDYTLNRNKDKEAGQFCSNYTINTGQWGLAWVAAYDLTGYPGYLEIAQVNADFMYATTDNRCGGGIYDEHNKTNLKGSKGNAVFIHLAAALHNRISGDIKYLSQAQLVWTWFNNSGLISSENIIGYGLDNDCKTSGSAIRTTQQQGAILGALVELWKATGESNYIVKAREIADAAISSSILNPNGILTEPCREIGNNGCREDFQNMKGGFVRNLGQLNRVIDSRPYSNYLDYNAQVVYENRNTLNQYGQNYSGPFTDLPGAAKQQSVMELFTATFR